jgi:hypothetical protein
MSGRVPHSHTALVRRAKSLWWCFSTDTSTAGRVSGTKALVAAQVRVRNKKRQFAMVVFLRTFLTARFTVTKDSSGGEDV